MTLLSISWSHAHSDALADMSVRIDGADASRAMIHAGHVRWDLGSASAGTELTLNVEVRYDPLRRRSGHARSSHPAALPRNLRSTTPVQIRQRLRLTGSAPPIVSADGPLDRRLSVHARGAGDHHGIEIAVDLAFLDVTDAIRAPDDPTLDNPTASAIESGLARLRSESEARGGRLRILHHTGGAPHLWAVYVPSALAARAAAVPALVFFPPGHADANATLATGSHWAPLRYLAAEDASTWGYLQPLGDSWAFHPWPRCRFLDQVDDAGRSALLVLPYVSGFQYGAAVGHGLRDMLRSLLVALWSGSWVRQTGSGTAYARRRFVGSDVNDGLGLGRLGIGGFSFGGAEATECWNRNRRHVDELYLFDPATQGYSFASFVPHLRAWATGDHRLRLVGADQHEALRAGNLHAPSHADWNHLETNNSVTLWPASVDFFHRSAVYEQAFARPTPIVLPDWDPPPPAGGRAPGFYRDAGRSTNDRLFVRAHLPSGGETGAISVGTTALIEMSTYLANARGELYVPDAQGHLAQLPLPFDRRGDVTNILRRVRRQPYGPPDGLRRHQWAVFGRQSPTDSMSDAQGYLELCLRASAF
jgi:hypothetical protein